MNSASIITWAVRLASIVRRCVDQRPRLATKHNKSPGQAWGISNPAGLVRRFVQVFRLNRTMSGGTCYDRCPRRLLVPRLCLGTHWCGGSCLLSSQTKDAFRRGRASFALSYQAEPQSLETRSHSATKLAIRVATACCVNGNSKRERGIVRPSLTFRVVMYPLAMSNHINSTARMSRRRQRLAAPGVG